MQYAVLPETTKYTRVLSISHLVKFSRLLASLARKKQMDAENLSPRPDFAFSYDAASLRNREHQSLRDTIKPSA
jgi:hypothetical protein